MRRCKTICLEIIHVGNDSSPIVHLEETKAARSGRDPGKMHTAEIPSRELRAVGSREAVALDSGFIANEP